MKYVLVEPAECRVTMFDASDMMDAYQRAGLQPGEVDHGVLVHGPPGIAIIVHQFGLFAPPDEIRYFQIGNGLYAGNAILYAFDRARETIDMPAKPAINFFANVAAVERAIREGQVLRPSTWVNDRCVWEWNK